MRSPLDLHTVSIRAVRAASDVTGVDSLSCTCRTVAYGVGRGDVRVCARKKGRERARERERERGKKVKERRRIFHFAMREKRPPQ
jgi:hypothetical protein